MARSINAGEGQRRSDTFFVDPKEIRVDWTRNGRTDTFTPESIARLAEDIRLNGQLQPIACRSLPGKFVEVVCGYNRLRAALLLAETDPGFRLEIKVYDGVNERDAFLMNVRENMIRTETSPIDNANNIRKLLNAYGFTKSEVADLYKRSPMWVDELMKLLTLPESVKQAVADGELAASTGVLLAKLPEAEAAAAFESARDQVDAEDALADADEASADQVDTLPLDSESESEADAKGADADASHPSMVDDAAIAEAIGKLPVRPKSAPKPKGRKPRSAKTPAEIQSEKTVRQARISRKAKEEAERRGVKVARNASDLRAILKGRQDDLSRRLVGYLAGEVSEDDLVLALDTSESPIIANGPVQSLRGGKKPATA